MEQRATNLELFYDLVFVFAITQVSHLLLAHLDWTGAGQAALVLLVVWWSWNYTTWATNELDPDSIPVRLLLIALMLAQPADGDRDPRGLRRPRAAVRRLLRRHPGRAHGLPHLRGGGARHARACARGTHPDLVPGLRGPVDRGRARGRPGADAAVAARARARLQRAAGHVLAARRRPRLGPEAWEVGSEHFAERFQLFVIIALGETIVITGATTAGLELDTATVAAFALAFLSTAALWWLYFNFVAGVAQRALARSSNRTLLARDAYTYLHVVIVAAILLAAVGDELVIAHPTEALPDPELLVLVAGPGALPAGARRMRLRMTGTISAGGSAARSPAC